MSDSNPYDEMFYIKQSEWEVFGEYCQFLEPGEEKDRLDEIYKRVKSTNSGDPSELQTSKYDYEIIRYIALDSDNWRIKINEDKEFRKKVFGNKAGNKNKDNNGKEPDGQVTGSSEEDGKAPDSKVPDSSEARFTANKDAYKKAPDGNGLVFVSGSCFHPEQAHVMKTYNYFKNMEHARNFIDWYTRGNGDNVSHFEFRFKYNNSEAAFELYRNNHYGSNIVETYADCALCNSASQIIIDLKFRLFVTLKEALEKSIALYTDITNRKDFTLGEIKEAIKKEFGAFDQAYRNRRGWIVNRKEHLDTLICEIDGMRADFDVYRDGDDVFVDTLCNGDCHLILFSQADITEVVKIIAGIAGKGEQAGLGYEVVLKEINEKSQQYNEIA